MESHFQMDVADLEHWLLLTLVSNCGMFWLPDEDLLGLHPIQQVFLCTCPPFSADVLNGSQTMAVAGGTTAGRHWRKKSSSQNHIPCCCQTRKFHSSGFEGCIQVVCFESRGLERVL